MAAGDGRTLQYHMNRLAGTLNEFNVPTLDAQGAARIWAGQPTIAAVHAATTAATSGVYAAGPDVNNPGIGATITAPSNAALVVDSHTMLLGERVLYWKNTDAKTNGVYTVTNAGSPSTKWVITRSSDADDAFNIRNNAYTTVTAGTSYGGANWGKTFAINSPGTGANGGIVFGTDNISFVEHVAFPTTILLDLVGCLNYKAGIADNSKYFELQGILNVLAGTSGLGENEAAARI